MTKNPSNTNFSKPFASENLIMMQRLSESAKSQGVSVDEYLKMLISDYLTDENKQQEIRNTIMQKKRNSEAVWQSFKHTTWAN